nr:NUDIX domain-containing protein [Planosporangium thailandense]
MILDGDDRLLLIERVDTGGWGLPGGFMEPGESFEETGRREAREELGLDLGELSLLGVFSGAEYHYRYPNGDEVFNVTAAYLTAFPAGARIVVDPGEAARAVFFAPDELPPEVISPERPIVEAYRRWLSNRGATWAGATGYAGTAG